MDTFRKAMAGRDDFFPLRVIGGTTAVALALLSVTTGISDATLLLIGIAAVMVAFPWQRLAGLRAGPFEFSLERAQVKGAIESIEGVVEIEGAVESVSGTSVASTSNGELREQEKARLEAVLSQLSADIKRARGSRVLWVDDRPMRVVAERRLFRAIGIETIAVSSCRDAGLALMRDNDFDLVITSLEKGTERQQRPDVEDRRSFGILLVSWLRGKTDDGIKQLMGKGVDVPVQDAVINDIAVIVYSAFPLAYIRRQIQPLADLEPEVGASNRLDDLLRKAIRSLADRRSNPIKAPLKPPEKKV